MPFSPLLTTREDPTGDWILVEFHDSILAHQRIGAYRRPPPVWTSLIIRVGKDSIEGLGTLTSQESMERRPGDTLLSVHAYAEMTFIHEPVTDRIVLHWRMDGEPSTSGEMTYRRLSEAESMLTELPDRRSRSVRFKANYDRHLIRQLFAGHYSPLDPNTSGFTLSADGELTGHPRWRKFQFHDYFGTLHPFPDDMDALYFTDAGGNVDPYNWRFSNDTLILRCLEGNGDEYWLGKGGLRFLKQ